MIYNMKKYYIPTSSLNFNNIFSSESISPAGFYSQRKFGYSSWTKIPENPLDGAIVLYESLKSFERPIADVEDHPMLLEVYSDEVFPILQEGVFYCNHTIYLNPWHTKVYFFTEQDKKVTLSLSVHSLETKMLRLYKNGMNIIKSAEKYPVLSEYENIPVCYDEIEKDVQTNKIKGLLYGYYIGAALSTSLDNVKQIHALLEIVDIISAVLSNPEKVATEHQRTQLANFLYESNKKHPLYKALIPIVEDPHKVNALIEVLSQFNIGLPFETTASLLASLSYESVDNSITLNKIQLQLDNLLKSNKSLLSIDQAEIICAENELQKIKNFEEKDTALFLLWVNNVLRTGKYNGKISPQKMDIATELTILSRDEYFKDQWESAYEKGYLNGLRRHLNGEKFEYNYDNGLLSSLAAVLEKGDDWEQLLRFMQYKEMNDYRMAFAIYGILNGFANLTRDFTDILLDQDRNYVSDVYKEFYGQLFDKTIETTSPENSLDKQNIKNIEETKLAQKPFFYECIIKKWLTYPEKKRKIHNEAFMAYLDICGSQNSPETFIEGLKKVRGFQKQSEAYKYVRDALKEIIENNEVDFLGTVQQSGPNHTDELSSVGDLKKMELPRIPELPEMPKLGISILDDISWLNLCERHLLSFSAKRDFKYYAKWLVNEYQNGKYAQEPDKSNKRIIEHLNNLLQKKIREKKVKLTEVEVMNIINYLKINYAN